MNVMKVLIVNNQTKHINKLKELLHNHEVTVFFYNQIDLKLVKNFDLIILSGGSLFSILGHEQKYKKEIEIIKNSNKPIIGICLGFELIAYAFGSKLYKVNKKIKGILPIKIINNCRIFNNLPNFDVYEGHRWIIKKIPTDFIELARSESGIEAFKHKDKNLYGFQFHPEVFCDQTCGDEIFYNLLNQFIKSE